MLRRVRLPWSLSPAPRAVAAPLPRATDPMALGLPLPTLLLADRPRGGSPFSSRRSSPALLGPAPRFGGAVSGDFASRHCRGLTPLAVGGDFGEESNSSHPFGTLVAASESSSGAARPLGGPAVGSPRLTKMAPRASTCVLCSWPTSPISATAAAATASGAASATVARKPDGSPGPSRAAVRILSVPLARTLTDAPPPADLSRADHFCPCALAGSSVLLLLSALPSPDSSFSQAHGIPRLLSGPALSIAAHGLDAWTGVNLSSSCIRALLASPMPPRARRCPASASELRFPHADSCPSSAGGCRPSDDAVGLCPLCPPSPSSPRL